jgi:predicted negative regulator of RcsB-dependent stress response
MDVMTYVLLAYTIILGGMYGWRQYTARQRDTARKELAGLQALGKYQSDSSNTVSYTHLTLPTILRV